MLYVSSSCIKKEYINELIKELVENDIKSIEFSGGTKFYDLIEQDLLKLKKEYELAYACHAYFPPPKEPFVVNLASCNDEIYQKSIKHYDRCIEMLERIGCHVLSVHAGFLLEVNVQEIGNRISNKIIYDEIEAYDRFCLAYEYLAKKCKEYGIYFYLENNVLSKENYIEFQGKNYLMMTDYESIMKMKRLIDFDLLLDLGHLNVSANTLGLDFHEECKALRGHVKWLHLSDNNGVVDQHQPLRENSVITREFCEMWNPQIDVTLETVGSIIDVKNSYTLVNNIMKSKV